MKRRTIVLSGTGTDLGKTHLAEALLRVESRSKPRLVVWKPAESGVVAGEPSDSERLGLAVAGAHPGVRLEPPLARYEAPLAPPLAARLAGSPLLDHPFLDRLRALEAQSDVLLVELAGGLFAPQTEGLLGVDVARAASHGVVVVVAANRLGVLHDVCATTRAARAEGCHVKHVVLMDPARPDPSTEHNPAELRGMLSAATVLWRVARAPAVALAETTVVRALAATLLET